MHISYKPLWHTLLGCEHLTPENTLNCRAFRGRFMGGVYDFIVPPGFAEILLTFWKGGCPWRSIKAMQSAV